MQDDRRLALEAIAYGDDPRITPGDRMKALEMLERLPGTDLSDAALAQAAYVQSLSGAALERELAGFFNPGEPPPPPPPAERETPSLRKRMEARARRLAGRIAAAEVERRMREVTAQQVPEGPPPLPPTPLEQRRLIREQRRAVQWAERIPPCPEGVDPAAWEMYADELDGV